MKRKSLYRKMLCLLLVCMLAVMCVPSGAAAAASETDTPTLRVGYTQYNGFTMQQADGTVSGYAVDYLNRLAQYTGYQYEYIKASWEECLTMLQNGEIDLVCSAGHTAERAQLYDFTRQNIITINAAMYTRADNTNLYYEDFAYINGQAIGVCRAA